MDKKNNNTKQEKPFDREQMNSLKGDESLTNVSFVPGENTYLNDTGDEE
ncbi:hypothetical protein [Salirhabdus sp. Marseille-P4669]|nr:hypothetical protein [Salirhabdus sp. Marseille-P4669]